MQNDQRAALREKTAVLEAGFVAAGALRVEADSLLPAETLLDLYGEDIRARAYVTHDPVLGERMLRPDFTVPIVQRHMAEGAEPARYTYSGSVWRKQDAGSAKNTESMQVGFELFDRADPAAADAEVFALFKDLLPDSLTVTTGDIGLLRAAVQGLKTSDSRRNDLMRHLWRPTRFDALLKRFAGLAEAPATRADVIVAAAVNGADTVIDEAGKFLGLRTADEIKARIQTLAEDQRQPNLSGEEVALLEAVFSMDCSTTDALKQLRGLAQDHAGMTDAVDIFEQRLTALQAHKVDPAGLAHVGNYGLTSMEYYDGFVFGFTRQRHSGVEDIVASGGRYDALTRQLGEGREIAAVGGVIRPEALL